MKETLLNAFVEMQTNYFKEIQKENLKDEPSREALIAKQTIIDTLSWAINVVKSVAAAEAAEAAAKTEETSEEKVEPVEEVPETKPETDKEVA